MSDDFIDDGIDIPEEAEDPPVESSDLPDTDMASVLSEVQNLLPSALMNAEKGSGVSTASGLDLMIPKDIQNWLMGGGEVPQTIRMLGNEVTTKMNWTVALILVQQFARIPRLMNFVAASEVRLYEDVDLENLDTSEVKSRYKDSMNTMHDVLDFVRKFSTQNREALSNLTTGGEDEAVVMQMLRSAPVEVLQRVREVLQEESGDISKG